MITAEKVYKDIIKMPVSEREKLFSTIARRGFEKDLYTHDEVFDDIRRSPYFFCLNYPSNLCPSVSKLKPKRIQRFFATFSSHSCTTIRRLKFF
jgi:hypothetical protein